MIELLKRLLSKKSLSGKSSESRSSEELLRGAVGNFFLISGKLVIADGVISESEINYVEKFIKTSLKLPTLEEEKALSLFHKGPKTKTSHTELAKEILVEYPDNTPLYDLLVDFLVQLSIADGHFSDEEQAFINDVAMVFNIPTEEYEGFRFHYSDTPQPQDYSTYYKLIGLLPDTSDQIVRVRFASFLEKYGIEAIEKLPEEMRFYAKNRYQRLEQAFKIILEERGISI